MRSRRLGGCKSDHKRRKSNTREHKLLHTKPSSVRSCLPRCLVLVEEHLRGGMLRKVKCLSYGRWVHKLSSIHQENLLFVVSTFCYIYYFTVWSCVMQILPCIVLLLVAESSASEFLNQLRFPLPVKFNLATTSRRDFLWWGRVKITINCTKT